MRESSKPGSDPYESLPLNSGLQLPKRDWQLKRGTLGKRSGFTMIDDLAFEALRGADSYQTSLAYWLGLLNMRQWPSGVTAAGLRSVLSFQYDIEEQAGRTGRLFPEDVEWRESFEPIAPVQLSEAWSPLPNAIRLLGSPTWGVRETGPGSSAAAVAWPSSALEQLRGAGIPADASKDLRRFRQLLSVAAMRGLERRNGLLLVACPGWSYSHGHTFDAGTQRCMRRARFAVVDRRPIDADQGPSDPVG